MILRFVLLILTLFYGTTVFAHQDSVIKVSEDGTLIGLPKEFHPAKIDLNKKTILIGKTLFTMPECISVFFSHHKSYSLEVSSSWYHKRSSLPPYINFTVLPKDKDYQFSLLFSLVDLKLLWVNVVTQPNDSVTFSPQIEIDKHCKEAISNSYETKP